MIGRYRNTRQKLRKATCGLTRRGIDGVGDDTGRPAVVQVGEGLTLLASGFHGFNALVVCCLIDPELHVGLESTGAGFLLGGLPLNLSRGVAATGLPLT